MSVIAIKTQSFELGYGQTHLEDLGVTPQQLQADPNRSGYYLDGVYQLNFSIVNVDASYPGYFQTEIDFGTQELSSLDGWGTRIQTQIMMVCPSPGYIVIDQALPSGGPVQGSNSLMLKFSVPGWALQFSNLSMTFTPQ